jgi:hypothetical protein
MTNAQFLNIAFEKNALHYLHYCTLEGESAESAKQKNDMEKLTKLANFRQNFVKIAKIVMQIFISS